MKILGIESSCDETSVSVVEDRVHVRSLEIASQIDIHTRFGGVVPEIASRAHAEIISSLTEKAIPDAGMTVSDIDAVAVTNRPGLIGALLVGLNFAKGFAYANSLPLITVNHIKGHIAANYITHPELEAPFMGIVMSGGHTSIIRADSPVDFVTVARTRDDAVGEAFDKCARVMGIGYPGGKEIDRLAALGDPHSVKLPVAKMPDSADFSFSGLKTAVINYVHNNEQKGAQYSREDLAASLTDAVCRAVTANIEYAVAHFNKGYGKFVAGGGVCANSHLRKAIAVTCEKLGMELYLPDVSLCGDNAAMIAAQAFYESPCENLRSNAYAYGDF